MGILELKEPCSSIMAIRGVGWETAEEAKSLLGRGYSGKMRTIKGKEGEDSGLGEVEEVGGVLWVLEAM